ncbi:uncharacterized protein LOC143064490 [Mytilus galloprovincialis]|uniref:uncharacterized protein LOC143064490 n=1 Tax=Mytilus galloprovincialis TaxID=29158 RepID=UPI003F7C37C0
MDSNLLEELNKEEAKQYIGGVVFVSLLMTLGIIGNLHVLIIYTFRMKRSNPRTFILFLTALDFITCTVGMPFVVIDLRNPLTFTLIPACKILRFINYFVCSSSAFILLVIAIDRYRKVCFPLGKQISRNKAKYFCLVALATSMILSWPAPILYGHSSVNTTNPNITGVRCFTEDKFKNQRYQAYFNELLIIVFFGMFVILVVLYILMAKAIAQHEKFRKSFPVAGNFGKSKYKDIDIHSEPTQRREMEPCDIMSNLDSSKSWYAIKPVDSMGTSCMSISTISSYAHNGTYINGKEDSTETSLASVPNNNTTQSNGQNKNHHRHHFIHFNILKRTTIMMFLITAVFLLSYMPHLSLKIIVFVRADFLKNMNFTEKILYNTFVWCFFINNMANCFIYGFFDVKFRNRIKMFYSSFLCKKK